MRRLLVVTAVMELGAGLALMCSPAAAVAILLHSPLDAPAAVTLGRIAGAALLALGLACWFARSDAPSVATRGVVTAMTSYNLGAVVVLGIAALRSPLAGVALWSAVVIHMVMTAWCIEVLLKIQPRLLKRTEGTVAP